MSEKIKNLKSYFNKGDIPTEAQFHELIDSFMLKSNDKLIKVIKTESNGDVVLTLSDDSTITIPKHKIPTSKPISFITGLQAALDTKAAKNGDAAQIFKVKDAAATNDAVSKQQLDTGLATKAAKNGDATQIFKVKDAAANDDAVSKQQLDTKAAKNGDATQIFKVKDAVNANDAISKQQFDAVFNRLIPAPFIDKIVTSDNKIYQQPNTTVDVNIYGSYFTPTSTITISGLTVTNVVFKSDNHIQVKAASTATTGSFDVTVNNGTSTTKSKSWIVSTGEITIPQPSDFTLMSGQSNISKAGEIKLAKAKTKGIVKFYSIPSSENFQLEFKVQASPLNPPLGIDKDWIDFQVSGLTKIRFGISQTNTSASISGRYGNGFPHHGGHTLKNNLEDLGYIKIEVVSSKVKFYLANELKFEFPDTYSGNISFQVNLENFDFVNIKKYKI